MISFAQTVRLSRPEINVLQMTSNFNDHVSDVLLLECRQRRLADPLVSYTADPQTRFCSSFSRTTVVCYSPFPSYEYQLSQMDPRDALPRVLRAVHSRRGQLTEAAILRNFVCDDGDLQFYAQRCNCKLTSRHAVPTVNIASVICRKCDSGWGSAPDPAGRAHVAPPDPVVGWGADTLPHTPPHSASLAPRFSRLQRLDRRAPA